MTRDDPGTPPAAMTAFDLVSSRLYALLTLMPLILKQLLAGDPEQRAMAAMMLLFVAFLMLTSLRAYRNLRETVAILKQADLAPLEVQGYGSLEDRLKGGDEIPDEERALMARALDENSVIVAQMEPLYPEDDASRG